MVYDRSHLPAVPSVDEYVNTLRSMHHEGFMTHNQYRMLLNHYDAPNHIITASDLAASVRYKNWKGANLQYGLLGKNLRDYMDYQGEGQESYVLAYFLPPGVNGNPEWLFIMHPEVAQAIKVLNWT